MLIRPSGVRHNRLPDLQGGATLERYHLTAAQLAAHAAAWAAVQAAISDTGGGAGNAGKLFEADAAGRLDGRDLGADGAVLDLVVPALAAAVAAIAAATTDTGGGAGNAGKLVELDGGGKLDGRDLGADGADLDALVLRRIVPVWKDQDQQKTNDNVYANDSALTYPVVSGSSYIVIFVCFGYCHATPDIKFTLNGPAVSACQWFARGLTAAAAGLVFGPNTAWAASCALTSAASGAVEFHGFAAFTPSADGTFAIQWAQIAADANASIVRKGSFFLICKVNP